VKIRNTNATRKVWIQYHNFIPKDINGVSYEIHHIDGNNKNKNDNKIENLIKNNIQKCVYWCMKYNIQYNILNSVGMVLTKPTLEEE
jgi:hypothetical protein